jgi:hypothetical protein
VAYVEEVEERKKKEYYSVLVKGVNDSDIHQVRMAVADGTTKSLIFDAGSGFIFAFASRIFFE